MSDSDHVRGRTSSAVNDQIDRETLQRLRSFADDSGDAMEEHVRRLEKEWDIERMLEINAATIGLIGLGLGIAKDQTANICNAPITVVHRRSSPAVCGPRNINTVSRMIDWDGMRSTPSMLCAYRNARPPLVSETRL